MDPTTRPRPRALRIGVVLGDTLIAEHLLAAGSFSIGRKAACTVSLPLPELPPRWELLTVDGRGARLRLAPEMDVRLADGSTVRTRAELGGEPGRTLEVPLPAGGRGKVMVGEVKVMFHEVERVAPAPRPRLPPELRASLAERVDRRVLGFAAASLALHVGLMAAAELNDPPAELSMAEQAMTAYVPDTMVIDAADLPPLPPLPPATDAEPTTGPAPAEPSAPAVAAPVAPRPERPSAPRAPTGPASPAAPVDHAASAAAAADGLFSDGGGGLGDPSARRRPSGDLRQQLEEEQARQASASIGDGSGRDLLPGEDGPRLGTQHEVPPGPEVGDVRPSERPPAVAPDTGRITLRPPPPRPPGDPSVESIVAKIRTTYLPGLVRCYRKAMASAGPMSGKVTLAFEVSDRGAVSGASATGVDDGLEQCIEATMKGWRFTPVLDGDGDPADVDVSLSLQLRPD